MGNNLFATKKQQKAPNPLNWNDIIQQFRQTVTQLEKREVHLDKKIQISLNNAMAKLKRRDKNGAIIDLRQKNQYEYQQDIIREKKFNFETSINLLEQAYLDKSMNAQLNKYGTGKKQKSDDHIMNNIIEDLKKKNEAVDQKSMKPMDDDELLQEFDDAEPSPNQFEDEGQESDEVPVENNDDISSRPNANVNVIDTMGGPSVNNYNEQYIKDELAELEAMLND